PHPRRIAHRRSRPAGRRSNCSSRMSRSGRKRFRRRERNGSECDREHWLSPIRLEASVPWTEIREKVQFSAEKLMKVSLFESERMFFDVYCLRPGQQQKIHTHDSVDKIYVVLSGSPTVLLGEEERVLAPMQAAWAPSGAPHGVRNDGPEEATLLVF